MKIFCFSFFLLFFSISIFAQIDAERKRYSIEALKEDFHIFQTQLEKHHTGLYEYTSKSSFDNMFQGFENSIVEPMTELAFWRLLNKMMPAIGNGHTEIELSEDTHKKIIEEAKMFPLGVVWLNEKLFVVRNNSADTTLQVGSEILSINGKSPKKIIETMVNHITRDGYNLTGPTQYAVRTFEYQYFNLIRNAKIFRLECLDKSGSKKQYSISPLIIKEIRENREKRYGVFKNWWETEEPRLSLKVLGDEKTAILKVQSFGDDQIKEGGQKYKTFLKDAFQRIENEQITKLIIDVRGNGGGDDGYGNLLYSYFAKGDFDYYEKVIANTRKLDNPKLFEKPVFIKLVNFARFFTDKKLKDGTFIIRKNAGMGSFSPKKNAFKGEVSVLIDSKCFSATGEFVSCVQHHKRGIFIGEEVGGNALKNTSGITLPLILPNTKLKVALPIYQYVMPYDSFKKGQSVKPDFEVTPSIEAYLNGEDVVLKYALERH